MKHILSSALIKKSEILVTNVCTISIDDFTFGLLIITLKHTDQSFKIHTKILFSVYQNHTPKHLAWLQNLKFRVENWILFFSKYVQKC